MVQVSNGGAASSQFWSHYYRLMPSILRRTATPDRRCWLRAASVWVALLSCSVPAHAQDVQRERWNPPAGVGEAAFLGANTLLGGLTAGLLQAIRGGSFSDGFTGGALGGAIVYAGKRVSVGRFAGAGLLGRELAAVGASVVRNAADAKPNFERLALPVGPINIYLATSGPSRVRVKVNLYQLASFGWAIAEPALSFEAGKSLSAGAPVFRARNRVILSDGDPTRGVTTGGTILLSGRGVSDEDAVFAHERVHVLQRDFYFHAWFNELETWLLKQTTFVTINRYVDIDLFTPLFLVGTRTAFGRTNRPEEIEADFLDLR